MLNLRRYDRLTPAGAIQEVTAIAQALTIPRLTEVFGGEEFQKEPMLSSLSKALPECEIVIWENSLFAAAVNGAEVFDGRSVPELFCKGSSQVWLFAQDALVPQRLLDQFGLVGEWLYTAHVFLKARTPTVNTDAWRRLERDPAPEAMKRTLRKMLETMISNQGKWSVVPFTVITKNPVWLQNHPGELGKFPGNIVIPTSAIFEGESIKDNAVPIIAAYEFMNSTVATARIYPANHHTRKEFRKQSKEPPVVRAVVLRRTESSGNAPGTMRSDIEWSCQWLVRGHWRKLNEPRKSDGAQVVYVQPYAKGPEDKPFRAPRETVFVAKR